MTEAARHVFALLRTMLAWCPGPKAATLHATPGFVTQDRPCQACTVDAKPDCAYCHGTRRIPVRDTYELPRNRTRHERMSGEDWQARQDRTRARDLEIDRLEQQTAPPAPSEHDVYDKLPPEPWETAHDRLHQAGDYALIIRALDQLRHHDETLHKAASAVVYQPFGAPDIEPTNPRVIQACEWIATLIGRTPRVPPWVEIWTKQELDKRAVLYGERATWRGRTDPKARAERDALIRGMHQDGIPVGTIAGRLRLDRRTVQRVLTGDTHGHEEAA